MEHLVSSNRSAILVQNSPLNPQKHVVMSKSLNKSMHPIPKEFFELGNSKILEIYSKLNPNVNINVLQNYLNYESKYFHLGGSDIFHVKTNNGINKMILVEMNPGIGGREWMPGNLETYERERVVWQNFMDAVDSRCDPTSGDLAVIYDLDFQYNLGSAAALAETSNENVWLVEYFNDDQNPPIKWVDGIMHVRDANSTWHPIRACYHSVKIKPWNRVHINSKTLIINNALADLCGAKNKNIATHAYELFNQELVGTGLKIDAPKTWRNVKKKEIPRIIEEMGGRAVVKVPYAGGGRGIYTILTPADFEEFMKNKTEYENYIVQHLVTPYAWRDASNNNQNENGQYFHVGTLKENGKSYVNDLRMVVTSGKNGFSPVVVGSRRGRKSIESVSDPQSSTWDILGTNIAAGDGDPCCYDRVLMCDEAEFSKYNMNLIDLINAYVISVLAVVAIDKMCQKCMTQSGELDFELFQSLNDDKELLSEILK